MAIANEFVGQRSILENTSETLWDRVLRMCDEWLATDARVTGVNSEYSQTILDGTHPISCFRDYIFRGIVKQRILSHYWRKYDSSALC